MSKYTGKETIKVMVKATTVSFKTVGPFRWFGALSKAKTPRRVPNWTRKLVNEIFPSGGKTLKLIIW